MPVEVARHLGEVEVNPIKVDLDNVSLADRSGMHLS